MDQSIIRCLWSPLPHPLFQSAHLWTFTVPPPLNLPHISYEQHDVTLENNHPSSPTSHLRRSTFRGGALAPGATLAWQTQRDSSFATVLFWWKHGANAPSVGSSEGKLFLQSVLSCRPEFSWREGVGGELMGYGRNVGRGSGEALWGYGAAAGGEPLPSSKLRNPAESWREELWCQRRAGGFDVALAGMNGPWRVDSQCACEFKSKGGTAASHGTNGDYTNVQVTHKDHQTYFISSIHS